MMCIELKNKTCFIIKMNEVIYYLNNRLSSDILRTIMTKYYNKPSMKITLTCGQKRWKFKLRFNLNPTIYLDKKGDVSLNPNFFQILDHHCLYNKKLNDIHQQEYDSLKQLYAVDFKKTHDLNLIFGQIVEYYFDFARNFSRYTDQEKSMGSIDGDPIKVQSIYFETFIDT